MNCTECDHPPADHWAKGRGICIHDGCHCNMFRSDLAQPPEVPSEPGSAPAQMVGPYVLPEHIPIEFIEMLEQVFDRGVKDGRSPGDWKRISPAEAEQKIRSAMRHLANGEYVAAAANCLIMWWNLQRKG